jgi:lipoprotein-anchoring transpeptidase ErfK/SrfK
MFSRAFPIRLAVAVATVLAAAPVRASVVIEVDKSSQQMSVAVDGVTRYRWAVSTARAGYSTPSGTYHPERIERTWFSREYYNSPMPHSIFFHNGYAIHGSYEISRLGGPASHGCVRLHPSNAATLYALVSREGLGATTIVVTGHGAGAARRHVREN